MLSTFKMLYAKVSNIGLFDVHFPFMLQDNFFGLLYHVFTLIKMPQTWDGIAP
jgi:hypothetical protein